MPFSRIRQDEVHTRGSQIDDARDPVDHDANAQTLQDTLDFALSQIREITGESKWFSPVSKSLKDVEAGLPSKSGVLIPGNFSGNPKRATVTFSAPFGGTNYAVTLTVEAINGKSFVATMETKTAAGFDVNLGVNNIANVVEVGWHAIENGET